MELARSRVSSSSTWLGPATVNVRVPEGDQQFPTGARRISKFLCVTNVICQSWRSSGRAVWARCGGARPTCQPRRKKKVMSGKALAVAYHCTPYVEAFAKRPKPSKRWCRRGADVLKARPRHLSMREDIAPHSYPAVNLHRLRLENFTKNGKRNEASPRNGGHRAHFRTPRHVSLADRPLVMRLSFCRFALHSPPFLRTRSGGRGCHHNRAGGISTATDWPGQAWITRIAAALHLR